MRFLYNNKIYETPNLEKKLKRMKISINDIEILGDIEETKEIEELEEDKKFYFINRITGYRHCSIYDICPKGYVLCTKKEFYATRKIDK